MPSSDSRGLFRALALSVSVAFALALAACSPTPATPATSGAASTAPSESAPATRQVQTDHGPVTVPDHAERVVAADYFAGFALVDLGVSLVGVAGSDYADQGDVYKAGTAGAKVIGTWTDVDYEAVLAVKPDLIVRSIDTDDEMYARLSAIAPTVVISYQGLSLTEVTQQLGAALGRTDEATALIASYDARAAELKQKYADVLAKTTFALATPTGDGQWWLYGKGWTDLTVLTHAGAELTSLAAGQTEQVVPYSFEQLDLLADADAVLTDSYGDYKEFEASKLWSKLPAVSAGRTFPITTGTSSIGNAMSLLGEFEDILKKLAAA